MFILLLFKKEAAKICELQICDMTTQSSTTAHDPASWPQPFIIHQTEAKPQISVKQTLRCLRGALNLLPFIKGKDNRLKAFTWLYNCVNLESTMVKKSSHLTAAARGSRTCSSHSVATISLHKIQSYLQNQNLWPFDLKKKQNMQRLKKWRLPLPQWPTIAGSPMNHMMVEAAAVKGLLLFLYSHAIWLCSSSRVVTRWFPVMCGVMTGTRAGRLVRTRRYEMRSWLVSWEGLGFADVSPLGFTTHFSLLRSYWRPKEALQLGATTALFICRPVLAFLDEEW